MATGFLADVAGRVQRPCPLRSIYGVSGGRVRVISTLSALQASASSSQKARSPHRQPQKEWLTGASRRCATKTAAEVLGVPDSSKLDTLEEEASRLAQEALTSMGTDEELDSLLRETNVYAAFAGPASAAADQALPVGRSRTSVFALSIEPAGKVTGAPPSAAAVAASKIAAKVLGAPDSDKLEALEEEAVQLAMEALDGITAEQEADDTVHAAFAAPASAVTAAAVELPPVGRQAPAEGKAFSIAASSSHIYASKAASRTASELLGTPSLTKLDELEAEAFRRARGSMSSVQSLSSVDEPEALPKLEEAAEAVTPKPYMEY